MAKQTVERIINLADAIAELDRHRHTITDAVVIYYENGKVHVGVTDEKMAFWLLADAQHILLDIYSGEWEDDDTEEEGEPV